MTTILILAGKRDGALDPLASAAGTTHKCVVPVAGKPMIGWVLEAAEATGLPVVVSINDPALLGSFDVVHRLQAAGRLSFAVSHANLVESVHAAAQGFPLMITTADNVLVTPDALIEADRAAKAQGASAMVAFARKESIQAAHPDGQRRFYPFRDGEYSNCNLFWLKDHDALRIADTFREGGQFVKHPRRIINAFGLINLVRFRFGLASLDGLMASLSRRFGMKVVAHVFADGRLAIDVDNDRTLRVAEELLAIGRGAG
ncbi:NTP transferase domain-containing protein [Sphingomonas sp. 1P06PA]|uniref:NTP transferase domain-containing protein n=1 Tax=Sphingomonas sp. 1P06PA TaxID=554121 RepID=UPI0039A5052D